MTDDPELMANPLFVKAGPHRLAPELDDVNAGALQTAASALAVLNAFVRFTVMIDLENLVLTGEGRDEVPRAEQNNRQSNLRRFGEATEALAETLARRCAVSTEEFLDGSAWFLFADAGTPRRFGLGYGQRDAARLESLLTGRLPRSPIGTPMARLVISEQNDLALLYFAGEALHRDGMNAWVVSRDRFTDHRVFDHEVLGRALANDRNHYLHILRPSRPEANRWAFQPAPARQTATKLQGESRKMSPVPDMPGQVICCSNLDCEATRRFLPGCLDQDSSTIGPAAGVEVDGVVHLWAAAEHHGVDSRATAVRRERCPYCGSSAEVRDRAFPTLLVRPRLRDNETFALAGVQELAFPLLPESPLELTGEQVGFGPEVGTVSIELVSWPPAGRWADRLQATRFRVTTTGAITLAGRRLRGGTRLQSAEVELGPVDRSPVPLVLRGPEDCRQVQVRILRSR